ncbi:MAG TPA: hypothetical protein VGQ83_02650 [Polyangia bacterium]|jgi:hypothetical protein
MARYVFPLLACLFLLSTSREPPWADAHVTYDTAVSLVDRGRLDITLDGPPYFFAVHKGKKYGIASLGNVLAMVPSYLTYKALRHVKGLPPDPLYAFCAHLSPALLMAGACVLFLALCRRRGASPGWAVGLTLALGLTTICFVYARSPYAEALQTFALVWLLERTLAQARRLTLPGMALLGLAAGVLFSSKIVYVLVLPLCAAYVVAERLRAERAAWRRLLHGCGVALAAFLPFVALALWHNWVKTGSLFHTGYEGQPDIMKGEILPALYGNTLSTGRSIFLYSPPIVLGLLGLREAWRRHRRETLLLLGIIGVVTLVSCRFRIWHGGYCWGPRYLAPLTPLLMLLALPWLPEALARGRRRVRRLALGTLLGAGLTVQLLGAAFYWDHYIRVVVAVRDQTRWSGWSEDHYAHMYYMPQFSPIRGHAWLLSHVIRDDRDLGRDPPWKELVPRRIALADTWNNLRVDWWANDWVRGRRPPLGAGITLLLLLGAGVLVPAGLLWRRLRRGEPAPAGGTADDAAAREAGA